MAQTVKDVKRHYPEVSKVDIERWYKSNVERNVVQRSGYNSYVAKKPLEEFQIYLLYMKSKTDSDDDEYKIAMGCIDIFSKYAVVIALHNKQSDTLLDGMKQVFKLMGKPAVLMTDQEGGLQTKQVDDYLKKENITYIINRNHAPFIERFVRSFRNMVNRRLQKREDERWYNIIYEVLLTYNRKLVSSVTHFTPADATKPENIDKVHMNMMHNAKFRKKPYEDIKVGDRVRVYRKRKHLSEKEEVKIWSKVTYEVVKIDNTDTGKLYYVAGTKSPYIRSQILLVK